MAKVLIVDEHRDCADSTAMLLEQAGTHEVRTAYSPEEGLALGDWLQPDIVLAEVAFQGEDGYLLGREIKKRHPGSRLFAVSVYSHTDAIRRSSEAGFEKHLVKPVDPEYLERLVNTAACWRPVGPGSNSQPPPR